ncbi:uncharacterized protein MEPE_04258 [Melanopsichium pennsylvanicum]|uniref:Uncharacterized protein n=2 Tax=Melanopsichium pennsylvanicum TaxID=63383 RepID=A0AAJ4XNF2_9BASI|nr:uncharacterized protein MEPE_04258 [Melanopsichium pennsylvanicum]
MAPNTWVGESQSSIAFSMNPRDSRVVSIYDKYLYDPKDLESSDPRRRELARKASQLKLHGRPANHMDANGLRSVGPSNLKPTTQRKSIAFSNNTKATDGYTASSGNAAIAQSRSSYVPDHNDNTHDRDSGAFGLGLGMLGGSDSESDSDSDDGRVPPKNPALDNLKRGKDADRPDSWTDRANAVGHRPPDHASQNPPSLKLMTLKSAKERGQEERNSRLDVDSNFVDRTSRHGSTIGFAGHPSDNHDSARSDQATDSGSKRLSARTALTKQLGLVTPSPEPPVARSGPAASSDGTGPQDYFDTRAPNATQARSPSRNAAPAPIDTTRAQQQGFYQQGMSSPMGSAGTPNSATPLRSPGYGPNGTPSPHGQGQMPPNVLQRGPPSPYGQRGPQGGLGGPPKGPGGPVYNGRPGGPNGPNTSPTRPGPGNALHPSSLQVGGARPPPPNSSSTLRGPGSQGVQVRGAPGNNFGPSFSDAPGPSKRQSIFRRSMAMLGGGGPQVGPSGNNNGPLRAKQQLGQGGQKRQSFFRRSMAMLTGGPNNPPPAQQGNLRMSNAYVPRAPQAPRVQGYENDWEKPDHPRKSQFLGAGGEGAEWDTNGEGAKFWRRFSMAQKTAGTGKLEDGSKAWMASMATGRKKLIVMGVISLVSLVGLIVGVIVWREIVSPSGSSSDEPKSIYKANLGAKDSSSSSTASVTTKATSTKSREAKASATKTGSSWYSRSLQVEEVVEDVVNRHSANAATHQSLTSQRLRKRHFGKPITAAVNAAPAPAPSAAAAAAGAPAVEKQASLNSLD